ncbi:MAG: UvrD-helicase domain-containing protein, partial [Pseudomonadota bacterium]
MSDTATLAQIAAARPDASTWVGANAGSGKTRVLTNRVARLLLHGTDPRRILCLTFTKAAAGEMQNRLFETLGTWAMLPDEELAKQLSELGETGLSPERLERARTLFASALETPGGLKIQTIHAFSEALLRRFPLEAGVPPRFDVLDDRGAAQLRMGIVEEMAADPGSGFAALAPYIGRYGTNPDELFRDVARMRMRFPKDQGGLAAALNLGAPPPPPLEAFGEVERLIEVLSAGGKTAAKLRDALLNLRAETGDLAAVEKALITGNWTVKANICTDDMVEAHPDAPDLCEALADAIRATREHEKAERAHASAAALGHVATEFLDRLDRAKQIAGALEFDDLIRRAAALLKDPGQDWIRYRLDGGTHHVLVDEAQDTSPEQWAIVDALTSEFFAGEGATEGPRTVFVVGDEKQSIYSFQGADPDAFEEQRAHYRDSLEAVGAALEDAALLHSFRSAPV